MKDRHISVDKRAWSGFVDTLCGQRLCLKLLIAVIAKINPLSEDPAQLQNIILDLGHLKFRMGLFGDDVIPTLKKAIKTIMSTPIEFEDERYITYRHFLEAPLIDKQNRLVTVNIHPDFMPFLVDLQTFLTLKERVLGASNRSVLFYATLKSRHSQYPKHISVDELQAACKVNYPTYGSFKQKFLLPVIDDLKQHSIHISFIEHKAGRKVDNLSFSIREPEIEEKTPQIETEAPMEPPKNQMSAPGAQVLEVFEYYRKVFQPTAHELTPKRKKTISEALKKYGFQNCKKAIDNMFRQQKVDDWLQKNATIDHLFNAPEITEKYINIKNQGAAKKEETQEEAFARLAKLEAEMEAQEKREKMKNGNL